MTKLPLNLPAAFRRLCVETHVGTGGHDSAAPAAFRRLCVETASVVATGSLLRIQPPSGGCVLKQQRHITMCIQMFQPPSGGCVLKLGNG